MMDASRCPHCTKRMKAVIAENGRTDFKCLRCDELDPLQTDAAEWAKGPLAASMGD
jgi:tRNA(Ile2) C34 agmatinyltransferase TiaS